MVKHKKRKASAFQNSQALAVYTPLIRPRSKSLSSFDTQLMHDAFGQNEELMWERTSNCKVFEGKSQWFVRLLRRDRASSIKGVRVTSCFYKTAIEAENAAFAFRYNLESTKSKEHIDIYKTNLSLRLAGTSLASPSSTPPNKLVYLRKPSKSNQKRYAMSSNLEINHKLNLSRNPNNCLPNSKSIFDSDVHSFCAKKIQQAVSNQYIRRSAKKVKDRMKDQAYRVHIIKYLSSFISTDTCDRLLLGSQDPEILKSFSPYDKQHTTIKARHIADALSIMVIKSTNEIAITWIQCCERATERNYKIVKRARTVADWYLQLHQYELLQSRRSDRGRQSSVVISPFAEDELLTM